MALTWVKIGNLKGPAGAVGDGFKRGLSSTTDNLNTISERGRFHAFATGQLAALGLPGASLGFFDNVPGRNGEQAMQAFMQQASRPHMFGRGFFGGSYSPWESFGFASINKLRSSDTIDSLVTGKAYSPLTGAIGAGLGLPSSGTVPQDGVLMVFGLMDGLALTVGQTDNVLLIWTTLSSTPGIFVRSKISGSWRDWSSIGGDSAPQSSGLPGQVSVWGSSTPEGVAPELSEALREYGVQVHQKASGGEWSGQTAARIGASSITLTPAGGSIPASGPVTVTSGGFIDGDPVNLLQPLTGWLGGVHGALTGIGNLATGRYEFTRTAPGAAISMASGAWAPEVKAPSHLNILGAGKNDLNVGRTAAHLTKVIARRDQAVAYWRSRNQDFLILGHFVNIGTPASDAGRTQIEADNADAKAKYPNNFIDMQELLSGTELWEWTGITPTPEDLAQQSLGNMPPSIQGSGNHLNEAGDNYLSYKIIQWMIGQQMIGQGRAPFTAHQYVVSPNGTRYRITASNTGALTAVEE